MYSVKLYNDIDKREFFEFCQQASLDTEQPAHVNMWDKDWEGATHTLPYLLEIEKRFAGNQGQFFVILHDNTIVGCSGIYQSDFSQQICLAGIRSWINKDHRGKFLLGRYLFPEQVRWAKQNNYKQIVLTFNEYNKNLKNIFLRNGFGVQKNRKEDSLFFTGVHEVDFPVTIKYTKQWVIYQKLDQDWDFDYSQIKHS